MKADLPGAGMLSQNRAYLPFQDQANLLFPTVFDVKLKLFTRLFPHDPGRHKAEKSLITGLPTGFSRSKAAFAGAGQQVQPFSLDPLQDQTLSPLIEARIVLPRGQAAFSRIGDKGKTCRAMAYQRAEASVGQHMTPRSFRQSVIYEKSLLLKAASPYGKPTFFSVFRLSFQGLGTHVLLRQGTGKGFPSSVDCQKLQ